jgi:hypothetical protein
MREILLLLEKSVMELKGRRLQKRKKVLDMFNLPHTQEYLTGRCTFHLADTSKKGASDKLYLYFMKRGETMYIPGVIGSWRQKKKLDQRNNEIKALTDGIEELNRALKRMREKSNKIERT